ncbi:MAG: DoxX family protein [Nevskiales bacterium]
MSIYRKIGLGIVFAWFFFGGIGHFLMTDFFVSIVPPYVPYPRAAVYLSAVFELLGAFGVLIAATRQWAGWGLILLTLAVTPANVHMWLHPEQFSQYHPELFGLRLAIQAVLLICIWWSTRPPPTAAAAAA